MTVREATPSDIPAIVDFQIKMARETENLTLDPSVLTTGVHQLFKDSSKGKYYVAEQNGHVTGCLMTTFEWSEWRNGNVLWIQSVYIDEKFRSRGVFTKLYEHIVTLVNEDHGLRGIRLYADKKNKVAQQVYQKLGMNGDHYQVYEWMKTT